MTYQGWAKAPCCPQPEPNRNASPRDIAAKPVTAWQVWKQVIIGEILNVMEGRRYDSVPLR